MRTYNKVEMDALNRGEKISYGAYMWKCTKEAIVGGIKVLWSLFLCVLLADFALRVGRLLAKGLVKFYEVTSV